MMVEIPAEHGGEIFFRVCSKEHAGAVSQLLGIVVVGLILRQQPIIKDLDHDEEAQLVAQVQEGRRGRVVGAADAVATHILQLP